jgi:hypothetical protein
MLPNADVPSRGNIKRSLFIRLRMAEGVQAYKKDGPISCNAWSLSKRPGSKTPDLGGRLREAPLSSCDAERGVDQMRISRFEKPAMVHYRCTSVKSANVVTDSDLRIPVWALNT